MTREITFNQVIDALDALIMEKGNEYTYQSEFGDGVTCEYVVDGKPACIVGAVLIGRLGLQWPTECYKENLPMNGGFSSVVDGVENLNDVKFSPEAFIALTTAQGVQDEGGAWGIARQAAISAVIGYRNAL